MHCDCSRTTTTRCASSLTELESTTERGVKTREELFSKIKGELTIHEIIEGDLLPGIEGPPAG